MTYTPGPWRVKWSGKLGAHFEVHADALPHRMVTAGVREEDAHLIAAAPEMLAVLEELEESAAYWGEYDVPLGIVERIQEAIRKARGEE